MQSPKTALLVLLLLAHPAPSWADSGAELYAKLCASCHGEAGNSDTTLGRAMQIPALAGRAWAEADVSRAIRENDKHKLVSGKVSEAELAAITAHLGSLAGSAQ